MSPIFPVPCILSSIFQSEQVLRRKNAPDGNVVRNDRREYKQRAEYKQIWYIHIGILTETSQNAQKQDLKICLKSACIPSFSLLVLGCLLSHGKVGLERTFEGRSGNKDLRVARGSIGTTKKYILITPF